MPSVALLGRCGLGTCMIAPVLICRDSSFILRQWHLVAVILSFFLQSDQESITSEREMTANAGVPLEG